ncbi:hypothetical protein HPP92_024035 [Vanilla planifolia]|uniref:Uncharacterized protein n=1 Tax=Vanilla planifolia TaxID=51239 RepID=A0A835UC72_VANPL|nr:hypothetical protein HPP92_024035 [Vanilla planifolia]
MKLPMLAQTLSNSDATRLALSHSRGEAATEKGKLGGLSEPYKWSQQSCKWDGFGWKRIFCRGSSFSMHVFVGCIFEPLRKIMEGRNNLKLISKNLKGVPNRESLAADPESMLERFNCTASSRILRINTNSMGNKH